MKFKVGDKVLVTAGKDKGLKSEIIAVFADKYEVIVKGANYYVKHVKPVPMLNKPGERIRKERPLSVGKIAILNDKDQLDRIGYKVDDKGKKVRFYKKTGSLISVAKKSSNNNKKNVADKKQSVSKSKAKAKVKAKKSSTKKSTKK